MKNLKKILFVTSTALLVYSCNTETKKQEDKENQAEQTVAQNDDFD